METIFLILSVTALGSVVFLTGMILYSKIRLKLPVRVNCWFCNKNTDVPYGNRNCWDCPYCEQYNGFLSDGSYNKIIPAQHDELLNHPVQAVSNKVLKPNSPSHAANRNGLCRKCNTNQELKVQQLAAFTPVDPANFDKEVDEYRQHLERVYRLCSPCEDVLKKTLHKQKSMLLGITLTYSRNILSKSSYGLLSAFRIRINQSLPTRLKLVHCSTTLLAAGLFMALSYHLNMEEIPLLEAVRKSMVWNYIPPVIEIFPFLAEVLTLLLSYEIYVTAVGALIQLAAIFSRKREQIDLFSLGFWILLHVQSWIGKWSQLEKYISVLDYSIIHAAVSFTTLLMCTFSALVPRRRFEAKHWSSPRKVRCLSSSSESSLNMSDSVNMSSSSSHDFMETNFIPICEKTEDNDAFPKDFKSISSSSTFCPFDPLAVPRSLSPRIQPMDPPTVSKYTSRIHPTAPSTVSECQTPIQSHTASVSPILGFDNSDDLDRGFGNLTLGSAACDQWIRERKNQSPAFETKVYGQNNDNIIFDNGANTNVRVRNKPLIQPSRLSLNKNMTHSSWVAGGYWHSPGRVVHSRNEMQHMPPAPGFAPLSRSSSQSSGFVSQSSQMGLCDGAATSLPNSHTGSIYGGDFDRFSALSEPLYPYATTPLYFAGTRSQPPSPPPLLTPPYYGGSSIYLPHPYSTVPPGFVSNFPVPQPRPAIAQPHSYYQLQPNQPLSPIWNSSAFAPPIKEPTRIEAAASPVDRLSRTGSNNSDESDNSLSSEAVKREQKPVSRQWGLISTVKENMFLAILFCSSLLFNGLIVAGVMLGNSSLTLPAVL